LSHTVGSVPSISVASAIAASALRTVSSSASSSAASLVVSSPSTNQHVLSANGDRGRTRPRSRRFVVGERLDEEEAAEVGFGRPNRRRSE
jgi:hypothetical protein